MEYVKVEKIIFKGKQNIKWDEVEEYLKKYTGRNIVIEKTGDEIIVGSDFAEEFAWSNYTQKLRGGYAKVKANIAQIIEELVVNADNKRWIENKDVKHNMDAKKGWYRFDVYFCLQVMAENEKEYRLNYYKGTMVVRNNDRGMYLYDIINIKKEARKSQEL